MKQTLLALLITFASLSFTSCASADSAQERDTLIAAYLDWRGGEAFANMQTLARSGAIEVSGLTGTIETIQTRDGRQRVDVDLVVIQVAEVLHPDESWLLNISGQVETMGEVQEMNTRRGLELELALPLFDGESNVSHLDDEERGGAMWGVLRIAYEDGDYHDLFIAEASGAMEWVRVKRDTEIFWLQFEDWALIDGVRLPGVQRELHDVAAENSTLTWAESALNMTIPSMAFNRPSAERAVLLADGAPSTGWIPFDYYRRQRIFLPATVNGVETFAILDSGAQITVLDTATAEAAGLEGTGSAAATGTGGTVEVQFVTGVTIQIGNMELRDLTVAILDLSELARRLLGRPIPIILGKEVFNEMIVDIDYPNRRIAFHDPTQWTYEGHGTVVALPDLEGSRSVEISVEGSAPINTGFDIGQGSALTLFENYVDDAGLLDGRATSTRRGGGVGGEVIGTVSTVRTVTFGGIEFENVPVNLVIDAEGAFDTTREQGNLGTGIFNRFRMIVNYGEDELYLEPDEARIGAPFDRDRASIQMQIGEGSGQIVHVMAGSPAEALGLAVGDTVVAIDGRSIDDDYWFGDQWRWPYRAIGTAVILALEGGREIELTLADFY